MVLAQRKKGWDSAPQSIISHYPLGLGHTIDHVNNLCARLNLLGTTNIELNPSHKNRNALRPPYRQLSNNVNDDCLIHSYEP